MYDVAARAGVALSTVSRALGDHPDVKQHDAPTRPRSGPRARVRAQLPRPEPAPRHHHTVGFLVRDIANPFFAAIANGAEYLFRQQGYVMLLVNSNGDPDLEATHIDVLRRRRVEGLILNLVNEDHQPTLNALATLETPYVLVDRDVQGTKASAVLCDHFTGVRAATGLPFQPTATAGSRRHRPK